MSLISGASTFMFTKFNFKMSFGKVTELWFYKNKNIFTCYGFSSRLFYCSVLIL